MPHASFFRVAHARDTRVTPLDIVYKWPLRATPPSPHLVLSPPPAYLFPDLKPLVSSATLPPPSMSGYVYHIVWRNSQLCLIRLS